MTDPIRLDKRVADLVGCSRADAQQFIENGWVCVDGSISELPQTPITTQTVTLRDGATLTPVEPSTMIVHKPVGIAWQQAAALVTPGSRSPLWPATSLTLRRHFQHLRALAPLDEEAAGLVVVTQDERVRRRFEDEFATIEQEYVVEVIGGLPPYGLAQLARGIHFEARALPPCKVSWQSEQRLRFAIKDVRPGQLRHMCSSVGLEVVAIKRIRIGRVSLGKIAAGEWRAVPPQERF